VFSGNIYIVDWGKGTMIQNIYISKIVLNFFIIIDLFINETTINLDNSYEKYNEFKEN
jgi:hypothetical protein